MKTSKTIRASVAVAAFALVASIVPAHAAGVDAKAAALVPAKIKKAGVIVVGVDATYAPNEYTDAKGNAIGWDPALFTAIAAKLGLKTKYVVANFDTIIPKIKGGTYDAGVSSFTDNKQREASVDFVDYYNAGIQWAGKAGTKIDPNNACGLTVAVQATTVEVTDAQSLSAACVKAKKKPIKLIQYQGQDQATAALVLGKVQAMSADSPVTEGAVKATGGKLQLEGAIYGSAPYGFAFAKGSTLTQAVLAALKDLAADGTYKSILAAAGVDAGAITNFGINGAIN